MRSPVRGLPLLLLAALLAPIAGAAPSQVHLGLPTSDPSTALSLLWLDMSPEPDPAVVLTGPDGVPRTFPAELVPGPSAGFAYEARLLGLQPGATYSYDVGGTHLNFTAPPKTGSFTFAALGDMGVTAQARKTVEALQALQPAFVLHAGDISYAEGDQTAWNAWFDMVEPVAARIPWITALGNHEANVAGIDGGEGLTPFNLVSPSEIAYYEQRFGLPGNERWYSFDWQGAHVAVLETFSELGIPEGEAAWLDQDLQLHANATWKIVVLHEPPYSSNRHGSSPRVQEAFVPLFEKHKVDLVIAAHDHGYERTLPILGGKPAAPNGTTFAHGVAPIYVVTGGAGASLYNSWKPGEWSAAHVSAYHLLLVDVTPERLAARFVPLQDTAFQDSFDIVKPAPPPAPGSGAVLDPDGVPAPATPLLLAALAAVALLARRFRFEKP